eukprot:SAG22_NODE_287_length_12963_cov_21.279086_7_plen_493_part_00
MADIQTKIRQYQDDLARSAASAESQQLAGGAEPAGPEVPSSSTADRAAREMADALICEAWAPVQARVDVGQIRDLEPLLQAWSVVRDQVDHVLPAAAAADRSEAFDSFAVSTVLPALSKISGAAVLRANQRADAAEERAAAALSERQAATAEARAREEELVHERHESVARLAAAHEASAAALVAATASHAAMHTALRDELAELKASVSTLEGRLEVERGRAQAAEQDAAALRTTAAAQQHTELSAVAASDMTTAVLEERSAHIVEQLAGLAAELHATRSEVAAAVTAAAQTRSAEDQQFAAAAAAAAAADSAQSHSHSQVEMERRAAERLELGARAAGAEASAAALQTKLQAAANDAAAAAESCAIVTAEKEQLRVELEHCRFGLHEQQQRAEQARLQSGESQRAEAEGLRERLAGAEGRLRARQAVFGQVVSRLLCGALRKDCHRLLRGWRAVTAAARRAKGLQPHANVPPEKVTEAKHSVAQVRSKTRVG